MTTTNNPSAIEDTLVAIGTALKTALPPGTKSLNLDGVEVPVADLITQVAAYAKTYADVRVAEAARAKAIQARVPIEKAAMQAIQNIKDAASYVLGKSNPDLKKFGFKPAKKRTKPNTKVLAAAAVAAKNTRDAGGKKAVTKRKSATNGATNGTPAKA